MTDLKCPKGHTLYIEASLDIRIELPYGTLLEYDGIYCQNCNRPYFKEDCIYVDDEKIQINTVCNYCKQEMSSFVDPEAHLKECSQFANRDSRIKNESNSVESPQVKDKDQENTPHVGLYTQESPIKSDKENEWFKEDPWHLKSIQPEIKDQDGWIHFRDAEPPYGKEIEILQPDGSIWKKKYTYNKPLSYQVTDLFRWRYAKEEINTDDGWIDIEKQHPKEGQKISVKWISTFYDPDDIDSRIQEGIFLYELNLVNDKKIPSLLKGRTKYFNWQYWKPADQIADASKKVEYCQCRGPKVYFHNICTQCNLESKKEYCQCDEPVGKAKRCYVHRDQYCGEKDKEPCKMEQYCAYCEGTVSESSDHFLDATKMVDNKSDKSCHTECEHDWMLRASNPILQEYVMFCKKCESYKNLIDIKQDNKSEESCQSEPPALCKCKNPMFPALKCESCHNQLPLGTPADQQKIQLECLYETRAFPDEPINGGLAVSKGFCVIHQFWQPCPNEKPECTCIDKVIEALDYGLNLYKSQANKDCEFYIMFKDIFNKLKELKDK